MRSGASVPILRPKTFTSEQGQAHAVFRLEQSWELHHLRKLPVTAALCILRSAATCPHAVQ
eukprot:476583-Pleurochrysis_carterae.AAC.1